MVAGGACGWTSRDNVARAVAYDRQVGAPEPRSPGAPEPGERNARHEEAMKYAINVPNFGTYADPRVIVDLAREAEDAGWDGFFVWDHILGDREWRTPVADPWVLLSAVAARTERIRLGPMVTPIPRRRPWKLARETVTLDHLSSGRLILGVGLGFPPDAEFEQFGEEPDARIRAEKLDEGLEILLGLWSGQPFGFEGRHFRVVPDTVFLPTPIQQPRIPIWVASMSTGRAPMRRAARFDGIAPELGEPPWVLGPDRVREIRAIVDAHRTDPAPYDVVLSGETPTGDRSGAADIVAPLVDAGMTWWEERLSDWRGDLDACRARVRQGPPTA
jgi:alkanesulfonate monooxygenase SsuD/methylene tetrahydromethanopterin reductase-like flavin-dependent oxidoreductase (luciferase family)